MDTETLAALKSLMVFIDERFDFGPHEGAWENFMKVRKFIKANE